MIDRTHIAAALLAVCGVLQAGLPENWQVYCFSHENAWKRGPHVPIVARNGVVTIGNGITNPLAVRVKDGVFDLENICGRSCNSAVLVCRTASAADRRTWFGVGGLVFAVRVNGETVYDFTGKGLGNDYDPVTAADHVFPVALKKGDNEIQIESCRSSWKLDFCYGKNRKNSWRLAIRELPDYQPVRAGLAHPELLSRPDIGSVVISFITKAPVPAGVEYRLKGTAQWRREWDLAGDCILREKSRFHRIRLSGLQPDSNYEYRLLLLEPPAGMEGFRRPLWSRRPYREILLPIKSFHTFGNRPDFSFFVLGDTQLSLSAGCKTVVQRAEYMRKMQDMPAFRESDFVVHAGDLDSYSNDLEKTCFTDFFDYFSAPDRERPLQWVYLRGNHEFCGIAAEDWYDCFLLPGEKTYYAFRRGEVLFIVLDCGDFFRAPNEAYNGPVLKLDTLFERQSRWLETLRRTPEFRSAKFRIVLSHVEPQITKDIMSEKMRRMTAPLLDDQTPEGRIHLWLCGHVHRYWRANRGSDELIARDPIGKWSLSRAPVTWVSVDAPKSNSSKPDFSYLAVRVTRDAIRLTALDENGREFDRFSIDPEGKVTELFQSPELKHFRLASK